MQTNPSNFFNSSRFPALASCPVYTNKYSLVGSLLKGSSGQLLDIGARDRVLQKYLKKTSLKYVSGDFEAPGCDFSVDLEKKLPFTDRQFDYVVALDVLEHVNNLHSAFEELSRITAKGLIIALPNMAYIKQRLSFALTGKLATDKYTLKSEQVLDRHRWLPSYSDITTSLAQMGARSGFALHGSYDEFGGSLVTRVGFMPMRYLSPGWRSSFVTRVTVALARESV